MAAACVHDSSNGNTTLISQIHDTCQTNDSHVWRIFQPCRPRSSTCGASYGYTHHKPKGVTSKIGPRERVEDHVWMSLRKQALFDIQKEPVLSKYYDSLILSHSSLEDALANHLAIKLSNANLPSQSLYEIFLSAINEDFHIKEAVRRDLKAIKDRDPACISYVHCFLYFKGFLAIQAHRIGHKFWSQGRLPLAHMIQNRVSEVFSVDIHPGATIGQGITLDHATGVVIGETAVVGNDVTILHGVTLGGNGKASGIDRHPKIGDGVLIGAGAKVLGNVRIGDGAKIGAGSVVLKEVPPKATVVGNPARLIGERNRQNNVHLK